MIVPLALKVRKLAGGAAAPPYLHRAIQLAGVRQHIGGEPVQTDYGRLSNFF
jgi:hypothetical protein